MSQDLSKRTSFEERAHLSARFRYNYPQEMFADLLAWSGIPAHGRILEIGCGGGQATLPLARLGYHILGIELGKHLASSARRRLHPYPQAQVITMPFEDWQVEENAFDLALAADSLHWIKPEIAYPRLAQALKPGGSAELIWRVPTLPPADLAQELDLLYQQHPRFIDPDKRFTLAWLIGLTRKNLQKSGCFHEPTFRLYTWDTTQRTAAYIDSLRTFSIHAGIDEEEREALYAQIAALLERRGGKVTQPSAVVLFHCRVMK